MTRKREGLLSITNMHVAQWFDDVVAWTRRLMVVGPTLRMALFTYNIAVVKLSTQVT